MSIKAISLALFGLALAIGVPFALDGSAVVRALDDVKPLMLWNLAGLAALSGLAKAGKLYLLQLRTHDSSTFARISAISLASDFAFLTTPAGVGGYVLNVTLLRRNGTPWSTATSIVAAEQALDLVFFTFCIPLCALFAIAPVLQVLAMVPPRACAILGVVGLLTAAIWSGRRRIADLVGTVIDTGAHRNTIGAFLCELRAELSRMACGDRTENTQLLLLTAVQWISRYGALWWVLDALDDRLPFGFILVLQATVLHVAQWTGIPGGGGSADVALAAILGLWLTAPTIAAVLPLWRFATLYVPLLLGALSFAALGRSFPKRG